MKSLKIPHGLSDVVLKIWKQSEAKNDAHMRASEKYLTWKIYPKVIWKNIGHVWNNT